MGNRTKYIQIGVIVTLASIFYALPGGYQGSITNTVQPVLENIVCKQLHMNRSSAGGELSGRGSIYISTITAAHPLGCIVGSSAATYLGDKFGPLRTLGGIVATIYLGSSVLLGVAMKLEYLWLIIVARIIFGIGGGMNNVLAHVYVAEVSPTEKRAIFNSILKCTISVGNLTANILGLKAILGKTALLPELFGMSAIFGLCGMAGLLFLPETPGHYVKQQQFSKASANILKLLGNKFTEDERKQVLQGIMTKTKIRNAESVATSGDEKKNKAGLTWNEILKNPKYRKPFFIAMILNVSMSATAQPMRVYSTEVFISYGLAEGTAQYLTIGIFVVAEFGIFSSIAMVHKLPRRQLFMVGLGMICVSQFLLAFIPLIPNHFARITLQTACWCTSTFFQMVAISPLRTLIPLEVCQTELRVKAFGVAISNARIIQTAATFATYPLYTMIHSWIFLIFAGLSFAMLIYAYTTIPETQNKTFHEISKHWEQFDRNNKKISMLMNTSVTALPANKAITHDMKF